MIALNMTHRDRARLYLAVCGALIVKDDPQNQAERARAEYALALTGDSDSIKLYAAVSLADEIHEETDGHIWLVKAGDVAAAYQVTLGTARRALRMCGWIKEPGRGDVWATEPGARDWWVPEADSDWWEPEEE